MWRVCGGVTAAVDTAGSRSLNCLRVIAEVWPSVDRDKPVVASTFKVHVHQTFSISGPKMAEMSPNLRGLTVLHPYSKNIGTV